jgi:hypothetical protein
MIPRPPFEVANLYANAAREFAAAVKRVEALLSDPLKANRMLTRTEIRAALRGTQPHE